MAQTDPITLRDGLLLDDVPQRSVALRDLTARDVLEASEAAEKPVMTADGWTMIISPTRLGAELLRRQIAHIGDIQGPLTMRQLQSLSDVDLQILQGGSEMLDEAVARAVSSRGRSDPAGAGG